MKNQGGTFMTLHRLAPSTAHHAYPSEQSRFGSDPAWCAIAALVQPRSSDQDRWPSRASGLFTRPSRTGFSWATLPRTPKSGPQTDFRTYGHGAGDDRSSTAGVGRGRSSHASVLGHQSGQRPHPDDPVSPSLSPRGEVFGVDISDANTAAQRPKAAEGTKREPVRAQQNVSPFGVRQ